MIPIFTHCIGLQTYYAELSNKTISGGSMVRLSYLRVCSYSTCSYKGETNSRFPPPIVHVGYIQYSIYASEIRWEKQPKSFIMTLAYLYTCYLFYGSYLRKLYRKSRRNLLWIHRLTFLLVTYFMVPIKPPKFFW